MNKGIQKRLWVETSEWRKRPGFELVTPDFDAVNGPLDCYVRKLGQGP